MQDDRHPVPRFFAFRSDTRMTEALAERFHVLSFTTVAHDGNHFQSFVLEKPPPVARPKRFRRTAHLKADCRPCHRRRAGPVLRRPSPGDRVGLPRNRAIRMLLLRSVTP